MTEPEVWDGAFYPYWGRDDQPTSRDVWAETWTREDRHIGNTYVGDVRVSTVWLGLNHALGAGPPEIYETMVFGWDGEEYLRRYSTVAQALAGHDQMVAEVRANIDSRDGS